MITRKSTKLKTLLAIVTLLFIASCGKKIEDLDISPWDQESDFQYVLIDSFNYEQSQNKVFIAFHVDNSVGRPKPLYWFYLFRDSKYLGSVPFDGETGLATDENPISGATYNYGIRFIANDGTNTKTFGPFPFSVP